MSTIRHCTKTIDVVIDKFLAKVRTGPDFVCTSCHSCHRMLYRHTVVPCKYTKADYSKSMHTSVKSMGCVKHVMVQLPEAKINGRQ